METVQSIVNTATTAIFGKTDAEKRTVQNETAGQEPVSGVSGSGNADEPFDKGNADQAAVQKHSAGEEPLSGVKGAGTAEEPFDKGNVEAGKVDATPVSEPQSLPIRTQPSETNPQTSGTADSTGANVDTTSIKYGANPKPADVTDTTADAVERAESGQRITDEEREILAEAGKLPKDPNDHSGEPMKLHDGGADSLDAGAKTERSKSVAQEGGGEHGKEKGTGTEWVKSTGLASDGGDFDVTKPGAGKEATRLLEEKGIKHDGDSHGSSPERSDGADNKSSEKASKLHRLKDKLHIGSGKHV